MKNFTRFALMAATVLSPLAAHAQDANDTAPALADDDPGFSNDIIVTARKRSETLQNVPTAVAVATAETIDKLGLDDLTDIAKTTSGLVFDDSFGRDGNRPVIRGQANILGQSGVAYFIDGIYYTGSLADYDVDTIERVEVVKGPQSALYGRNTYSGAINIISKLPGDFWEGRVQADISENDRYDLTAGIRGPLGGGFGLGVNGRFYDYGGEYESTFDGAPLGEQSSWSVSGALTFDNGGPLTGALRGYFSRLDDGQPANFTTTNAENNCLFDNGGLYNGNGRYFCGTIEPRPVSSDYTRQFADEDLDDVGLEADTYNISLKLDFELTPSLTLTSLSGYNNREVQTLIDGDYSDENFTSAIFAFFPFFPGSTTYGVVNAGSVTDFTFSSLSETEDWSQELRLTYESDVFDVIVGGYYFDQSDDTFSIRNLPDDAQDLAQANLDAAIAARCAATPGCAVAVQLSPLDDIAVPRDENLLDIRNIAAFGAVEFHFGDFNIGLEGRYAEERIRQTAFNFNLGEMFDPDTCEVDPDGTSDRPCAIESEKTFKEFTPRITADYQITPDNLLYAIYAEGQKPGGFNGVVAIEAGLPTFDPEDVESFEVGLKNRFLDGALIANIALFRNKVKGYQLSQLTQTETNSLTAIVNAGDARIYGAEIELVARPSDSLTFTANYSLADSKFTDGFDQNEGLLLDVADDQRVNCSLGKEFPELPCTVGSASNSKYGSIEGRRIPRAPVHTVFADVDWRQPIGTGEWEFFTGANVSMTSTSYAQVHNLAETGGSVVVDARIGFGSERFKIQGYVKNLTNEDSVAQIIRYADPSFRRNFQSGLRPGRRFGVILSAGF